jgi:acetoin utilization protein AcuB
MDTSLWMARDLLTIGPTTTLSTAARRMAERRVRHLLVVDPPGSQHLVGLVSSHDLYLAADAGVKPTSPQALARAASHGELAVASIMTPRPTTIASTTSIADAARLLRDKKFGCLPVVDRGELVGVLAEHDLLRAFLAMSGADQDGYEITCELAPGADVIGGIDELARQRGLHLGSMSSFELGGKRLGVVHFLGPQDDAFVDALWRSGHRILRVRATGRGVPSTIPAPTLAGDRRD